ncbi:hypothetical protein Rcae01_02465 [Novipirellula caenicola]|uniref:Uncharacterized protein n=1 Tax=Novipirellula caenicola TaxID=1536901 RepID=A0ABP9VQD5_9BACT
MALFYFNSNAAGVTYGVLRTRALRTRFGGLAWSNHAGDKKSQFTTKKGDSTTKVQKTLSSSKVLSI